MSEYIIKNNILGFYNGILSQWYGGFKNQDNGHLKIDHSDWFDIFKRLKFNNHQEFLFRYEKVDMPSFIQFNCCEQAMMFGKAIIFSDWETADKILNKSYPGDQKKLGRLVKGYDQVIWDKIKFHLVTMINMQKFTQNLDLKQYLLNTGHLLLAKTSTDMVWGTGIPQTNKTDNFDIQKWTGENLLGRVLMSVRETLNH